MTDTGVRSFDSSVQTAREWLNHLMEELHHSHSEQETYQAMRAVLQVLRDRLPVENAAQFAAQLPLVLKGVYYEGWDPSGKPEKIRSQEEFIEKIREALPRRNDYEPERFARAVFKMLEERLSGGELKNVKSTLPKEILELWPREAEA
jgi:uncharacterized protein (DUF2267 family)